MTGMNGRGSTAVAAGIAIFLTGAPLHAQRGDGAVPVIILSDNYGRGISIGTQTDSRERLEPASVSGVQIADEFKRLCLDTNLDPAALVNAGAASSWGFSAVEVSLPQQGKVPAFRQSVLSSPSARASIWLGDDAGLRKRPILIRDRGALVTSGYGPFKASGNQCNLDLRASGLVTVEAFVARMSEHLGVRPTKLVAKRSFADGHWTAPTVGGPPMRVSFSAVDLTRSWQLVHIVLQAMPGPAR